MEKEEKKPLELSGEEREAIEKKCFDLSTELKCYKVHACVLINTEKDNERVIAYIQEPSYMDKLAIMDKASTIGGRIAGEELRNLYLLKDHSHPLTYGEHQECDRYKFGVVEFIIHNIIEYSVDVFKKK